MKQCVLHPEKVCNDCGECDDRCILDPNKICDNCFKCLESDERPFAEIPISGVFFDDEFSPEGEGGDALSFDDAYVLDQDAAWQSGSPFHLKALPNRFGVRRRRKR